MLFVHPVVHNLTNCALISTAAVFSNSSDIPCRQETMLTRGLLQGWGWGGYEHSLVTGFG